VDILGFSQSARALVAAAIAFVPAIVAYVRGRQIARFADDPALPERLFAGRHRTSRVLAVATAMLLMITGSAAIWAIPLAVIAYCAAGLPLRRTLYNETWSLRVYLLFVIRFFIAGWSFWILVSALPALALWGGEHGWIAALMMGAGLMLLTERQTEVIRWVIGARPISDEAIRTRFDRLVSAAGLAAPHFEFVDLTGGSVANAFAAPSLRRSAVVFTGPLLQRLDADETDAICAHELAHLEYYNPKRLRRQRLVSRSLIAGGVLLSPLLQQLTPSFISLACVAWPCVVLISLLILVHDRQKHETASDLRAVALTGNPEALVRALVKLHAIARVPRRWDVDLERHMSHPSLKRRIQDIRTAAGTAPATLGTASMFESADGAARVIFHDESLEWIEGASASYRLRYDRLSELRIEATPTRETRLLAGDRAGHRWQMPIRLDDVPRIQAVLDIVDTRVETSAAATSLTPQLTYAVTFVVLIVSLNAGLIAVSLVVAMNFAQPSAPLLFAAGLAAMAGAVISWRNPTSMYGYFSDAYGMTFAAVLLAGGALLVWLAYARRRDEIPMQTWKLVAVVAVGALVSWFVPIMGGDIDALGLHRAAREWPSTALLPLALAGAMMWSARKALRLTSAVAVVASAAAAVIGSQTFLDKFGRDLFLMPATNLDVRTLNEPVNEFIVPFSISELQLSPGGRSIAAIARGRDNRTTIHIGRAGDSLTPIDADGALFIDDDSALAWSVDGSRTDLREVRVAAPESASWQLRITGVSTPAVSLDAESRRWRLASRAGVNVVEAREGVVGTDQINSYRWSVPTGRMTPVVPIALSRERALAIEPRPDLASPISDPLGAFMFVLASAPGWRSSIWALGPDGASDLGTSRLELQCHVLPLADRGACHVFDASRTRFFAIEAETRGITPVGSLPGRFFPNYDPQGEWLTGWYQSSPIAVRVAPADAIRIADQRGTAAHILTASDRAAAGVWYQMPATSGLRVDPLYPETGTSIVRIYLNN